ncbi:MAG: HEAT repeat domain-containing protein [Candidatus Hodarchaeales archaeon]
MAADPENEVDLEKLLQEINSFSSYKRAEAIKEIGQLDIKIQDIPLELHSRLEKALADPAPEVRKEAIMALVFLERELALPLLEPMLDDKDQSVRSSTIAAYSFIQFKPHKKLINKLTRALNDSNPEIRDRAARALGRLKVLETKDQLIKLAKSDKEPLVRSGAIAALGMMAESDNKDLEVYKIIEAMKIHESSDIVINTINDTLALILGQKHLKKDSIN